MKWERRAWVIRRSRCRGRDRELLRSNSARIEGSISHARRLQSLLDVPIRQQAKATVTTTRTLLIAYRAESFSFAQDPETDPFLNSRTAASGAKTLSLRGTPRPAKITVPRPLRQPSTRSLNFRSIISWFHPSNVAQWYYFHKSNRAASMKLILAVIGTGQFAGFRHSSSFPFDVSTPHASAAQNPPFIYYLILYSVLT
jgi:hypothetical protein